MAPDDKRRLALLVVAATSIDHACPDHTASLNVCLLVSERPELLNLQAEIQKIARNSVFRVVTPIEAARILDLWLKRMDDTSYDMMLAAVTTAGIGQPACATFLCQGATMTW